MAAMPRCANISATSSPSINPTVPFSWDHVFGQKRNCKCQDGRPMLIDQLCPFVPRWFVSDGASFAFLWSFPQGLLVNDLSTFRLAKLYEPSARLAATTTVHGCSLSACPVANSTQRVVGAKENTSRGTSTNSAFFSQVDYFRIVRGCASNGILDTLFDRAILMSSDVPFATESEEIAVEAESNQFAFFP
jgi:hypothetical protein